ncbi:shortchain dehydrogenase/reductase SDR, putative [Acanthamoeba castellanii str. Neff]|uniref:Shortchain dehydrogenase/reductase SDR, putative n=1 Tax=Acanthamoeba castellanii (strain ATCC 30010 / Neff) TaxID=1257118 RepID=L8GV93_ACACF|nr:shortchain dehydrogenase/reductase SDR, putative [Acanthamoeba castellanii str. Neff]ELR16006.1 shortchain dehydrogenase/reductase SDR, putative [Acanthamoeba castellanii str. Neff]
MEHNTNALAASRRVTAIARHVEASAPSAAELLDLHRTAATNQGGLLKGQVAIVTGSGQGIGEATAHLFAAEGAKVVVTDLDKAKSDKVAADIKAKGGEAISVAGDVTDPKFPEHIIKATIDAFGRLDILVNNAGYTWDGIAHRMTDKQWEAMLLVHNTAPFRLIRAAAPYMRDAAKQEIETSGKAAPRSIINVSSTSGLHGNTGQANYATAKAGILGLTKTIAKEWGAFNIRCNAVAFGWINTRLTAAKGQENFIEVEGKKVALGIPGATNSAEAVAKTVPLARPGNVDDAAGSVLLLASPHASYITGHCLEVTGGAGI